MAPFAERSSNDRTRRLKFAKNTLPAQSKFKMSDFRSQELFDLIDTIYRRNLNITITSNFTLKELGELEKVHPSFIRRIDEICRVLEV